MSAYIALTGSAEQEQVEGFNPLAKWKGQGTVRPHPLTEILKVPPVRTQQDHQEKGEPMSSISVNGKGRPKATIQATQGDLSFPPPMISLPVWGRNGLQPPIEGKFVWKVELQQGDSTSDAVGYHALVLFVHGLHRYHLGQLPLNPSQSYPAPSRASRTLWRIIPYNT